MHVLLQNSIFYPRVIGGAEHSTLHLARALSERGHRVDVLTSTGTRQGDDERIHRRKVDGIAGVVHEATSHGYADLVEDSPGLLRKGLHHLANVRSKRWERLTDQVLESSGAQILHTNTIVGMTGSIWKAAAGRGVPVVHTLRDYHLLCPRTTLLRSSGVECTNAPVPCRIYRSLKRPATQYVQLVTAPSRFVLEKHLADGAFAGVRGEVVPNACPPPVDPVPARENGRVIQGVYLGQLDRHKGVDLLMRTLTRLFEEGESGRLRFEFAGDGPLVEEVRAFCGAWSQRTRFHGYVDESDKDRLLRQSDFLVFPSVWNEPFGRVMLDAFRYGIPVIGTDRGGIAEVLRHDRNGLVAEPTEDGLAAAVRLYLDDPGRRRAHGERGYLDVQAYGLDRQAERFVELYEELIDPASPQVRPAALRGGGAA